MIDLDVLERLADAATPGPWTWDERGGPTALVIGPDGDELASVRMNLGLGSNPDRDAAYIAAADPSTVKALIARIRELEDRVIDWEIGERNRPSPEWNRTGS